MDIDLRIKKRVWSDSRIEKLEEKIGKEKAWWMLVHFWKLAAECRKTAISERKFKMAGMTEDLFDCELAIRVDGVIRAKGDKTYQNLKARRAAGRKSAKVRKEKYGTSVPIGASNYEKSEIQPNTDRSLLGRTSGKSAQTVIAAYCEMWKLRYGSSPVMSGQQIGQITRLIKEFSEKKLIGLLDAYLKMNDSWFIKKRHDLVCFGQNLQAIGHFKETGQVITNARLKEYDQLQYGMDQLRRIDEGEL